MKILIIAIATLININKATSSSFIASTLDFLMPENLIAINHKDDDPINFLKRPFHPTERGEQSFRRSSVKYLVDVYNSLKDEEDDVYDNEITETKRRYARNAEDHFNKYNNIVTFSSKPYHHNITGFKGLAMRFNLTGIASDYFLAKAEIRLYQSTLLSKLSGIRKNFTVVVYDVTSTGTRRMSIPPKEVLSTFDGWMQLDVTSSLSKALRQRRIEKEYLIGVHCEGDEFVPEDFGILDVNSLEEYQPFLIGFFDGPDSGFFPQVMLFERQKRAANFVFKEQYRETHQACARMNFTIHVKDLDMDDVILAPKKFDAYFCSGECNFPLQAQMNATNHALIQTLAHLKNPSIPKPSCAPKTLGSIRVLENLNGGATILKPYRNSVVKTCGCQ